MKPSEGFGFGAAAGGCSRVGMKKLLPVGQVRLNGTVVKTIRIPVGLVRVNDTVVILKEGRVMRTGRVIRSSGYYVTILTKGTKDKGGREFIVIDEMVRIVAL